MARVVAQLVDVRGDQLGQPIVLLQVDRQVGFGLAADFGERLGVLAAVDGDANDVRPGSTRSLTCRVVASISVVLVAVMLCTAIGRPAPISIVPMRTARVFRGGSSATIVSVSAIGNWLLRRSGLGQLMGPGLVLKFIT